MAVAVAAAKAPAKIGPQVMAGVTDSTAVAPPSLSARKIAMAHPYLNNK
jgi:hypothetical protein